MTSAFPSRIRLGARIVAFVGVFLAVVTVRVLVGGKGEMEEANAYRQAGDVHAAMVHYRRALRWYAPLSPYPGRAIAALREIAGEAEREGDLERALYAHRAIRSGIMATRSTYIPHEEHLREANRQIARLMAAQEPPLVDAGMSEIARRREYLAQLSRDPGPSVPLSLLALFGFFTWVGGAFAFAARAIDAEDRFIPREASKWGSVVLAGFLLFCVGLYLA